EPLLEDAFNEDIKTKLCSTRRRFPDDENYESQSDIL
uniref:RNA-dependent RNA polymerase n=1 Tax=Strongyloides venezuelensis TaxID=75913 RepID=A0A0K0FWU2_STRVS